MRQIDHPHMVRLFEWYEDANRVYLVLDYLKGGSLKDVIVQLNKKDRLPYFFANMLYLPLHVNVS